MRETANMLAMTPEEVAIIAKAIVNHAPYWPKAGRDASARE